MQFDDNDKHITAMLSLEGEAVPLKRPVKVLPEVEVWLMALANEMKETLKELLVQCYREQQLNPSAYPSQVFSNLLILSKIHSLSDSVRL